MKNKFSTIAFVIVAFVFAIAFLGCEGEEGPAGPAGTAGADGTAACGTCHNVSTSVLAKQIQYRESTHFLGSAVSRGGSSSCTMCHSSEGFTEKLAGMEATAKTEWTMVNCRTCHNIHMNYDETDYALTTTAAVTLSGDMNPGAVIDIGKGNLCANCHQTRLRGYENLEVDGTGTVAINSSHWGPHHGTQTNYFTGEGGFEVPGSLTYTNSYHTTGITDGCVTCHLYEDNHTFEPSEDACAECHSDIDGIDEFRGVQAEIAGLMTELETHLLAEGLLGGEAGDTHPNNGASTTANKAGALMNYQGLLDDGSMGIHNVKYIRAMLQNSIEVFE